MSQDDGIVFQVETARILKILASEIYDSPLAMLRENLQNAYDAVRMRLVPLDRPLEEGKIEVTISADKITISDNGIGMTEKVLTDNFWKAGSSGKRSEEARRAGVVGSFGIGAMANFGVCTKITVTTRSGDSGFTLISTAERDKLKFAEKCISLQRLEDNRQPGTTVSVDIDPKHRISVEQAKRYLDSYVRFVPVEIKLNGELISKQSLSSGIATRGRTFATPFVAHNVYEDRASATVRVRLDQNGQVFAEVSKIAYDRIQIDGSLVLLQGGGPLMGLRSYFGLAAIPSASVYQFGGFANLSFLEPTAGREAITRDGIEKVARLIGLAEYAASLHLSTTEYADQNTALMQYAVDNKRYELTGNVKIRVFPDDDEVPVSEIKTRAQASSTYYYGGKDKSTITTFSGPTQPLFISAQTNPRRAVHLHWLQAAGIQQVPDSPRIIRPFPASELDWTESSILIRTEAILRDDYLLGDVEVVFSEISHGVMVLPIEKDQHLTIHLARSNSLLGPLIQVLKDDHHLFPSLMKDFVRNRLYPHVQQYVPSSTRNGVDALRKILERNRELYRYEAAETGELESILDMLKSVPVARMGETSNVHAQFVSVSQVGRVETVIPDFTKTPEIEPKYETEFGPRPPILREEILSEMKILETSHRYSQLNNFRLLLGLSDKIMREYLAFFRTPHSTRILWGGHRVIYIFSEPTGHVNLYYDVELRQPLESSTAGGAQIPTTTLITGRRIFVPVPDALSSAFQVLNGPREFFVRFDLLISGDDIVKARPAEASLPFA
jgi:molecular chaperone HtpG